MSSPLAARLSRLEALLLRDDREPALLVAFTTDDSGLVDGTGQVIDPDMLSPQTTLVILGERPDGPA